MAFFPGGIETRGAEAARFGPDVEIDGQLSRGDRRRRSEQARRITWIATRGFRAKFAPWTQTRGHRVIRLSDAVAQLESAIGSIACCSGSEG